MKKIVFLILIFLPVLKCFAQTVYKDQVRIENKSITRGDDNRLTISMDVVLQKNMKVSSNRAAILTPIIEKNGHNKELQPILVYGRRRQLYSERNSLVPANAYKVVRRKSNTEQRINYLVQVPYEAWMQQSKLVMDADLCGCCNAVQANTLDPISTINIERTKPSLAVAYIEPRPELVKQRIMEGSAKLDFPVNKTTIYPNYRNNQSELAKIRASIDTIRNDKNVCIKSISLSGFASPEGSYANNARLAKGRTAALLDYVRNYYDFPKNYMHMTSTPEDWVGYRDFVANSNLDKKDQILKIIDSKEPNLDVKERRIAALVGPKAYSFIHDEFFVALRHTDYKVLYTVCNFTVKDTREVMDKHPQQLSLQEIYELAKTYKTGSDDYNHCFQVAVLMFPDDPTANLNASSMELQRGNVAQAKKYLAKADQSLGATQNNLGLVDMLEGNYDSAQQHFQKAKDLGIEEASANLKELAKQRSFPTE